MTANEAAIEIARILLEFEIQRQKNAAASEDTPATATTTEATAKVTRRGDSTTRHAAGQVRGRK